MNKPTTKFILYVGLNDQYKKRQIMRTAKAIKITQSIILQAVNGYTLYTAKGAYKHKDGTITKETTLKIELFDTDEKTVYAIIETLKTKLNQESIVLQTETVNSLFI